MVWDVRFAARAWSCPRKHLPTPPTPAFDSVSKLFYDTGISIPVLGPNVPITAMKTLLAGAIVTDDVEYCVNSNQRGGVVPGNSTISAGETPRSGAVDDEIGTMAEDDSAK